MTRASDTARLVSGGAIFNEASNDVDFRVESNGNANMLVVNAGDDKVGIGTNAPAEALEVKTTADADYGIKVTNDDTQAFVKVQSGGTALYGGNSSVNFVSGGSFATGMNMDANGHITKPLQPSFYVDKTDSQQSLSVNSDQTINFNSEAYDTATAFASDTFTAPVTGKYYLNVGLLLGNPPTDANYLECAIVTSNRRIGLLCDYDAFDQTTVYWAQNFSCVVDMDANDTAAVRIYQAGGTANAFVYHNSASTYFCGILIG